jgi:3-hydroxyacyl-[acyl-carrier protein] dehydratase/trans-2-decenoyl-[acyl-carrier protein] isomerase
MSTATNTTATASVRKVPAVPTLLFTSLTYQQIVAAGAGELIPGAPLLPKNRMLMFERITQASPTGGKFGKGFITAELKITPKLWFFEDHFQSDPVMPGCLELDALWQLTGFFAALCGAKGKGRALGAGEIEFSAEVPPETTLLTYLVEIKKLFLGRGNRLTTIYADGSAYRHGTPVCTATDLKVGIFPAAA